MSIEKTICITTTFSNEYEFLQTQKNIQRILENASSFKIRLLADMCELCERELDEETLKRLLITCQKSPQKVKMAKNFLDK
ncbi:MAG: hypothetical protein QXS90_00390 [Candidatus Diapherotrites archaeon]